MKVEKKAISVCIAGSEQWDVKAVCEFDVILWDAVVLGHHRHQNVIHRESFKTRVE
jgi:hypothetical protein